MTPTARPDAPPLAFENADSSVLVANAEVGIEGALEPVSVLSSARLIDAGQSVAMAARTIEDIGKRAFNGEAMPACAKMTGDISSGRVVVNLSQCPVAAGSTVRVSGTVTVAWTGKAVEISVAGATLAAPSISATADCVFSWVDITVTEPMTSCEYVITLPEGSFGEDDGEYTYAISGAAIEWEGTDRVGMLTMSIPTDGATITKKGSDDWITQFGMTLEINVSPRGASMQSMSITGRFSDRPDGGSVDVQRFELAHDGANPSGRMAFDIAWDVNRVRTIEGERGVTFTGADGVLTFDGSVLADYSIDGNMKSGTVSLSAIPIDFTNIDVPPSGALAFSWQADDKDYTMQFFFQGKTGDEDWVKVLDRVQYETTNIRSGRTSVETEEKWFCMNLALPVPLPIRSDDPASHVCP